MDVWCCFFLPLFCIRLWLVDTRGSSRKQSWSLPFGTSTPPTVRNKRPPKSWFFSFFSVRAKMTCSAKLGYSNHYRNLVLENNVTFLTKGLNLSEQVTAASISLTENAATFFFFVHCLPDTSPQPSISSQVKLSRGWEGQCRDLWDRGQQLWPTLQVQHKHLRFMLYLDTERLYRSRIHLHCIQIVPTLDRMCEQLNPNTDNSLLFPTIHMY